MSDCCCESETEDGGALIPASAEGKRLVVIGGGSAAFAAALKAADLGAEATIVNGGLPMGGTCTNVGCVPSKTLIRAAEALHRAAASPRQPFAGIVTSGRLTDFKAVMDQKRQLVEELRQAKYAEVIAGRVNIHYMQGHARLIDSHTVEVNEEHLEADGILIATGAKPKIPAFSGIGKVDYLTNESAFELEALPESLIVLGGRYIALECAQMFARLGSRVTVLQRSSRILPDQPEEIGAGLTHYLRQEGLTIATDAHINEISRKGGSVTVAAEINGKPGIFEAERILVATGRLPNTADMGLENIHVETDPNGFIRVNEKLETNVRGIYAAGDVTGENMFVYAAAYEGALAAENALTQAGRTTDYTALPWVVFTDPQVAGVGLDAHQAQAKGFNADVTELPLEHIPRALAARDTRGFIQLIRDQDTDRLLGARILAPEGSELLMEISLAIKFGITVNQLRNCFHPYLTLGEGVKLAALTFDKDVAALSCCAV